MLGHSISGRGPLSLVRESLLEDVTFNLKPKAAAGCAESRRSKCGTRGGEGAGRRPGQQSLQSEEEVDKVGAS